MRITLTNSVHNTSVTIEPRGGCISKRIGDKAIKILCPFENCTCGVFAGCSYSLQLYNEVGLYKLIDKSKT